MPVLFSVRQKVRQKVRQNVGQKVGQSIRFSPILSTAETTEIRKEKCPKPLCVNDFKAFNGGE